MTDAQTIIPDVNALMQPLQFTADDLAANRTGELGAQQRGRLRALQQRAVTVGGVGFIVLVLLATILLFFGAENGLFILTLLGIFMTMINALFTGIFARQWMRLNADLRGDQVEALTGDLERVVVADRRAGNFVLQIAGARFSVKKEVFNLFRHEMKYTVYRTPHAHVLLAAEPHDN